MCKISFDNLPEAIVLVFERLDNIEQILLLSGNTLSINNATDNDIMTVT